MGLLLDEEEEISSVQSLEVDDHLYANLPMTSQKSIPVEHLLQYIRDRRADDNLLFLAEFKVTKLGKFEALGAFEI